MSSEGDVRNWLRAVEERCAVATEGPWGPAIYAGHDAVLTQGGTGYFVCDTGGGYGSTEDADFIAAARSDLPVAVDLIKRVLGVCHEMDMGFRRDGEDIRQELLKVLGSTSAPAGKP